MGSEVQLSAAASASGASRSRRASERRREPICGGAMAGLEVPLVSLRRRTRGRPSSPLRRATRSGASSESSCRQTASSTATTNSSPSRRSGSAWRATFSPTERAQASTTRQLSLAGSSPARRSTEPSRSPMGRIMRSPRGLFWAVPGFFPRPGLGALTALHLV